MTPSGVIVFFFVVVGGSGCFFYYLGPSSMFVTWYALCPGLSTSHPYTDKDRAMSFVVLGEHEVLNQVQGSGNLLGGSMV